MSIMNLKVHGIRSFKETINVDFALPDNKNIGSGMNILVGPNNSGKSSLIETLYLANKSLDLVPKSIRNQQSNSIYIEIAETNGNIKKVTSMPQNEAIINYTYTDKNGKELYNNSSTYILSSKRNIGMHFSSFAASRENFLSNNGGKNYREDNLSNNIGSRFKNVIESSKEIFNYELQNILGYLPDWSLDSDDGNNLYISFKEGNTIHSNTGSGDGLINLFIILTALYDAPNDSTIVIDEPEIALHPDVQKRLMQRLEFHSKTKQIIISTHSPYFINLNLLENGAKLFRFYKEDETSKLYQINPTHIKNIKKLQNTIEQPYLQDIKSKEIFFFDKLILVEGPDDIYGYSSIFNKFKYKTSGHFYGWGVGGAERIDILLEILNDLSYKKVVVLLDNDKSSLYTDLCKKYKKYKILCIAAKDIRYKEAPNIKNIQKLINTIKSNSSEIDCRILDTFLNTYITQNEVNGIITKRKPLIIDTKYEENIKYIISEISSYFGDNLLSSQDDEIYAKLTNINNEKIAEKILNDYISSFPEKTFRYIESKYLDYTFTSSGGGYDLKRHADNLYYYELQEDAITDSNEMVSVKISITVDIVKLNVTNIDYIELKNTLNPIL